MVFPRRSLLAMAMARLATAQSPPAPTRSAAAAAAAARILSDDADKLTQDFYNYMFIVLASLIVGLTIWRVTTELVKYVRTLTCLNNDTQRYFISPSSTYATFKKNLLYAPIFSRRHSREFKLSSAINVKILPTRFQLLFLLAYFGTNIAFCVVSIDWKQPIATLGKQLRNRTGVLALVNLVSGLHRWEYVLFNSYA